MKTDIRHVEVECLRLVFAAEPHHSSVDIVCVCGGGGGRHSKKSNHDVRGPVSMPSMHVHTIILYDLWNLRQPGSLHRIHLPRTIIFTKLALHHRCTISRNVRLDQVAGRAGSGRGDCWQWKLGVRATHVVVTVRLPRPSGLSGEKASVTSSLRKSTCR